MIRRDCSRSFANKLGSGWEIWNVQRPGKRQDDDGHSLDIGLTLVLLMLAAFIIEAKALPPQTNIGQITKPLMVIVLYVRGENTHVSPSCEA